MSNTPYQPWMHSLLDRMKELYGKTNAKTISEALPDGDFFEIKGSVAEVTDLPDTGNKVGDIYIVAEDGSEYIWVTNETYPDGYWEKLGNTEAPLFCTFTRDSNNSWVCDKTIAQMGAAYAANRSIIFIYGKCAAEAVYYDDGADSYYVAQMLSADNDEVTYYSVFMVDGYGPAVGSIQIKPIAPGDVVSAIQSMSSAQASQALSDLGGVESPSLQTKTGSTVSVAPVANTIYNCTASALTSLTITDPPATGEYSIVFTSGSTATTTTIPATILGLESFAAEANTLYEINVLDNRAVVGSWAVSSS